MTSTIRAEPRFQRPTPERENHNRFEPAGAARRVKPMIDRMLEPLGIITQAEHAALLRYRQQIEAAEKSEIRDSLDPSPRGGNNGHPIHRKTCAQIEVDRMNRALGPLRHIAYAVCFQDMSLNQWAVHTHGGRERYKNGRFIEIVPRGAANGKFAIDLARHDLKFAAARLMKLGA